MRGSLLTPAAAMAELERLLRVYARPTHAPADPIEFARTYVEACSRDVSSEQFTQAVTEYLRTDARFFPKPGELRAFALKQPGRQDHPTSMASWLRAGMSDLTGKLLPCPVCNRAWQWSPRLHVVHHHLEHRRAGEACVGRCDEPRCLGAGVYVGPPKRESEGAVWEPPSAGMLRDDVPLPPEPVDERVAIQTEAL